MLQSSSISLSQDILKELKISVKISKVLKKLKAPEQAKFFKKSFLLTFVSVSFSYLS